MNNLFKYQVNFPAEAIWIAWLTALTGLVTAILVSLDVNTEIIAAVAAFIPITGRLITGIIMPEPSASVDEGDSTE